MKILIVTDIDNPGLKEDCFIARSFIRDGHHVTLARQDYDEKMDELFDVIAIRNIWHFDSINYEKHKNDMINLRKRLKNKNIPTINLYGTPDTKTIAAYTRSITILVDKSGWSNMKNTGMATMIAETISTQIFFICFLQISKNFAKTIIMAIFVISDG